MDDLEMVAEYDVYLDGSGNRRRRVKLQGSLTVCQAAASCDTRLTLRRPIAQPEPYANEIRFPFSTKATGLVDMDPSCSITNVIQGESLPREHTHRLYISYTNNS